MLHPVDQIRNFDDYPYPSKKELLKIVSDYYDGKDFYALEQGIPFKLNINNLDMLTIKANLVTIGNYRYGNFTSDLKELYEFSRDKIMQYKNYQLETLDRSFREFGFDVDGLTIDKKLEKL